MKQHRIEVVVWVAVAFVVTLREEAVEAPAAPEEADVGPVTVRSAVAPVTLRDLFGLVTREEGRHGLR